MGGSEEDEAPEVSDVFSVVGEVWVEFKVEVYVQVVATHYYEAIGVFFLVDDQQSRTVLLPFVVCDVDKHFGSRHEQDGTVVFVEPPL